MNITELSDEELKVFLKGQPIALLRNVFTNFNSLKNKIRGFRPNKAPLDVLVQTSFNIIRREKNANLIEVLERQYDGFVEDIDAEIERLQDKGYPYYAAKAIVINKRCSNEFREIYYKLEGITAEDQRKLNDTIDLLNVIRIYSSNEFNDEHKKDFEKIESLDESISILEKEFKNNTKLIDDLNNKVSSLEVRLELNKKELAADIALKTDSKQFDKKINEVISKIKADLKDLSKNGEVIALRKEIEILNNKTDSFCSTKNGNLYHYDCISAGEFSKMDDCEYLKENIGDVLEELVPQEQLDVLEEHIIETLYGNKPIITTTKNIDIVSDIYASILTGGEYYSVNIGEEYSLDKLISTIEKIAFDKVNLVVALKGFINIYDYRNLLGYLSKQPFTHKFIFDIHYLAEARFMASETLDEFYFFFAKLNNKQIKYKFTHVLNKRDPIVNSAFEKTLSQLGVSLDNANLYNVKFYGQLAYSIIPFVSANVGVESSEMVNRIIDPDIRRKCEVILDD